MLVVSQRVAVRRAVEADWRDWVALDDEEEALLEDEEVLVEMMSCRAVVTEF